MKIDKAQAKHNVQVYSGLLSDRAVISTIDSVPNRDNVEYTFSVYSRDSSDIEITCQGIKHLAITLEAMWYAYEKSWFDSGFYE